MLTALCYSGLITFIVLSSQFFTTEKCSSRSFLLASEFADGLNIEGRAVKSADARFELLYAVVFDAGSTGSRVHVFKFHTSPYETVKLVDETFKHVKPGLSSFSTDPLRSAHSLGSLLETCLQVIPKQLQASTPLTLKATAGLRLLSRVEADGILHEVTEYLERYTFSVQSDGIGIMDGVDEGVFSWITVNYLLGQLSGSKHPEPALDLGGASTQITFVPRLKETVDSLPADFMKNVSLFGTDYQLYTHSYLGLGLMAARFTVTGGEKHRGDDRQNFPLTSSCLPQEYRGHYTYSGKTYNLSGPPKGKSSLELCISEIRPLVTKNVLPIPELSHSNLYLFAYFFDIARYAKLIEKPGGEIKLREFREAAYNEFQSPDLKRPFLGFDLTYIYCLLHDGYHIGDDTQLHLKEKIGGVEVSWALGAAFNLLTQVGLIR